MVFSGGTSWRQSMSSSDPQLAAQQEELAQFIYIVSHDLNAPVRHLTNFAKLIVNSLTDEQKERNAEFIEMMESSASQIKHMLAGLLKLSRVHSQCEQPCLVDLKALVVEAHQSAQSKAGSCCQLISEESFPALSVSASLLVQVIEEIIINAISFAVPGAEATVEVQVRELPTSWELRFHDQGIGMAAGFHEHAFCLFRRWDTSSRGDRVGVGLAFCRKAVAEMGGHIYANPTCASGTEIVITLPRICEN